MKIDGGCHCGNISYTAEVAPEKVGICHCTDCQTLSGTAFRVSVPATKENFQLTGNLKIYVKTAESGAKRAQGFGAECGTPIYATQRRTRKYSTSASVRRGNGRSCDQNHKDGIGRRAIGSMIYRR